MITFKNKDAYPSNISGFRLGVGSTLAPNTLFAYEVGYIQTPPQAKTSPDMNISIATKAITADVAYTFNPQSRFPVRAFVGALAVNVIATKTATASGYSLTTSAQDLQPFIGGAFGYQISSHWAVKVVIPYGFVSFSKIVNSNITPFLMVNYYPV